VCDRCPLNCKVCSSKTVCTECDTDYKLLDSVCTYFKLGYGYRTKDSYEIEACLESNCAECANSADVCTKCKTDFYFAGGCCDACTSNGNYKLAGTPDTCVTSCTADCVTCAEQTKCLVCDSGKKVLKSSGACVSCSGGDQVTFGNYCYDGTDCTTKCQKCATTSRCETCQSGYYIKTDGTCGACSSIHADCTTCSDKSTCTSCSGDLVLQFPYTLCVDSCAEGYVWATVDTFTALYPCPENCKTCGTDLVCTKCNTDYYLAVPGDYCVAADDCKNGKSCYDDETLVTKCIISETLCENCNIDNCETCLISGKCLTCSEGFYVQKCDSLVCVESCNSNTQLIIGNYCYEADDCKVDNCLQCGSAHTCAVDRCATGYFRTSGGQCASCGSGCDICEDESACCSCNAAFPLNKNAACVTTCGGGYYASGKNFRIRDLINKFIIFLF
jgi:proprotein convertase subtilisin/kexin type 5